MGAPPFRSVPTPTSSLFVDSAVPEAESEALTDATYPLFLECGRQISPHFVTEARATAPQTAKDRNFFARIAADRRVIWQPQ